MPFFYKHLYKLTFKTIYKHTVLSFHTVKNMLHPKEHDTELVMQNANQLVSSTQVTQRKMIWTITAKHQPHPRAVPELGLSALQG